MADTPPKRKRGRPRKKPEQAGAKAPDPSTLGVDDLAEAEAAAAKAIADQAGDTPPGNAGSGEKPKAQRKKRISKAVTQQIEDGLAEILQIPAVPASILGDPWLAQHFTEQGRALAARIAIVSERNPVLRGWCERAVEGESVAVLLMAGIMYAAPPLMHFGVLPGGEFMGVPVLRRQAPEQPIPAPEQGSVPPREAPDPKPYGGEPVEAEPAESSQPLAAFNDDPDGPPTWQEEMID